MVQLQFLDRFQEQETIAIDRKLERMQRRHGQSTADFRSICPIKAIAVAADYGGIPYAHSFRIATEKDQPCEE